MATGDITFQDGTVLTPADLEKLLPLLQEKISSTAKDPGQYPVSDRLDDTTSIPCFDASYNLIRIPIAQLKGNTGTTPDLTFRITALPYGSAPKVEKTGTLDNPVISIGLPSGKNGEKIVWRKTAAGIEVKYEEGPDSAYQPLLTFADLTPDVADFSPEGIAILQQPAAEAAAEARQILAAIQSDADAAVQSAGVAAEAACASAKEAGTATEATRLATEEARAAAENVQDGKTPAIVIGTVEAGISASATLTDAGTDESGNPRCALNLVLPKGPAGQPPVVSYSVLTGAPGSDVQASQEETGQTPEGNPIYRVTLTIPRGEQGLPGSGNGNVKVEAAGLLAGEKYWFVPSAADSPEGTFVAYEDAPADGKTYGRKDGAWSEIEARQKSEVVKLSVTSNQAQPDADLQGAAITLRYAGSEKTFLWEGVEISTEVPAGVEFTVSCRPVAGYATPAAKVFTAVANTSRPVTFSYNTTVTRIEITSNQAAADSPSSATVHLTGGFMQTLSGASAYLVKIPTGAEYTLAVESKAGFATPPSRQVTAVGATQTETCTYLGCKIKLTVSAREGTGRAPVNIYKNDTLWGDSPFSFSFDSAVPPAPLALMVPLDASDRYRIEGLEVSGYATPAPVTFTPDVPAREVALTYAALSEQDFAYWVVFDESQPTTTLERGGNEAVRDALRAKFKRCMALPQADGKAAIAYLNETDSTQWPDGSEAPRCEAGKHLMVYFPAYYYRSEKIDTDKWKYYVSDRRLNEHYKEERACLIGAFEAYADTSASVHFLCSRPGVVSTANHTITEFYQLARQNGNPWGLIDYRAHKTIAHMFAIMYGNTNISTPHSQIPCSGGTKNYETGNTGETMSLGNADGLVRSSSSFLGVEDCYYGKWEFVQGVNIREGGRIRVVYDGGCFPDKFDAALVSAGATHVREIDTGVAASGYITKIKHGEFADVMPVSVVSGSSTTYYADYNSGAAVGPYIFLRSGDSGAGAQCGVFVSNAYNTSPLSAVYFGSRLGFYGTIEVKTKDEWLALTPDYNG